MFEQLNNINKKDLYSEKANDLLRKTKQYLESDLRNIDSKFSKAEYEFYRNLNYLISYKSEGLKKYFPFFISDTVKNNLKLLKEINDLFENKIKVIKTFYEKDILIIDEFHTYAKQTLSKGHLFYCEETYKDCLWRQGSLGKIMFNYLSYQIRINPYKLTREYLDEIKIYFSLRGLNLDNEDETRKANDFFSKNKDPFGIVISHPDKMHSLFPPVDGVGIAGKIRLAVLCVIPQSDELFDRIANDVMKKYAE